jgi:hypothetical protein
MMYPWAAISRRWPLIEYEAMITLTSVYTPLKDVFAFPKAKYILLKLREINLTTNGTKHKNSIT